MKTTAPTTTKNEWMGKLTHHRKQVVLTGGCLLDAMRRRLREHDADKMTAPKAHHYTARHHGATIGLRDYNVIDFFESCADAVTTGFAMGKHVIYPVSQALVERSDYFITFVYNSLWATIQARFPQDKKSDWLIEVELVKPLNSSTRNKK